MSLSILTLIQYVFVNCFIKRRILRYNILKGGVAQRKFKFAIYNYNLSILFHILFYVIYNIVQKYRFGIN